MNPHKVHNNDYTTIEIFNDKIKICSHRYVVGFVDLCPTMVISATICIPVL